MLEDEWITLGRIKKPVVEMVNAVLNRTSKSDLPWPLQAQLSNRVNDAAQVVAALMDNNPELAMSYEIAAARSRVELAQKRSRPNITLGLEWMQMDKAAMPGGHRRDAYLAMVSITLPLWTNSYNAGVQVPLIQLADIEFSRGPDMIKSEDTFLVGYVLFDGRKGFAEIDVVEEAYAFLAVLTSTGRGTDVMIPMAIPSFGGMVVSIMDILIVPVLFCMMQERKLRKATPHG